PSTLIDINPLPFRGIDSDGHEVRIGALTRLADIIGDEGIQENFPALAQALQETASPQVRNMATAGGNLLQRTRCLYFRDITVPCNKREPGSGCPALDGQNRMSAILGANQHCIAAYAGDMANALLALDAELILLGPRGERRIPLEKLHREPGDTPHIETNLQPGELIAWIVLPVSAYGRSSCYLKLRDRATFEWALASAAAAVEITGGKIRQARIAAGGVATRPWRLRHVERILVGNPLDEATCVTAGEAAALGATPCPGNAFKIILLRHVVQRALLTLGGFA
ncbi:MAG: FAD binding domain-containing protein, partial [Acetobacteraceae bacterium]|nr:FAD binding domain-containing protein [Acetobacteraceae bacterium]